MVSEKLFNEIRAHIKDILVHKTALGKSLWEEFIKLHPIDIATFLSELPEEQFKKMLI